MSAATWIALALLLAAIGGFINVWARTEPEVPENVDILRLGRRWTYVIKSSHSVRASLTGYFTRGAAIRAARAELDRLEKGIET